LSIFEPEGLWEAVRERMERPGAIGWLLLIPIVGALAVAIAAEMGVRVFTTEWNAVLGYSARPDDDGARLRLLLVALAVAPLAQAATGWLILPLYGSRRRARAALAVAVVGTIPLYLAGLSLVLLPGILLVLVAFFVSLVWWITGARQLLGVPHAEASEFVTITVLAASSALFLCSTALPF
jgi:hypothetical protein